MAAGFECVGNITANDLRLQYPGTTLTPGLRGSWRCVDFSPMSRASRFGRLWSVQVFDISPAAGRALHIDRTPLSGYASVQDLERVGAAGAGPTNLEGERNVNERCRNEVLRGVRDGQGLGWLQGILPPERDLHGAGRAPGGREDARHVLRLDEGAARLHAGRSIRAKGVGGRRTAQERLGVRRLSRDPHRSGRSLPANGQEDEYRLCLRHAVRRRQDQAHAEDLARRPRNEGARLDLKLQ